MGLLHKYFEEKANNTPEAVALRDAGSGVEYTFAQLNKLSNQLAHKLIQEGIEPGDPVAVSFPGAMSAHQYISMLAVLKIGAVYVPIGSGSVAGRKQKILDDAQPKYFLGDRNYIESAHALSKSSVIKIIDYQDLHVTLSEDALSDAPIVAVSEDSTAYCVYTSSSNPKGVPVTHKQITGYWPAAFEALFSASTADAEPRNVMAFASPGFDASLWEMMMTWSTGSTYCIPDSAILRNDFQAVFQFIATNEITDALITPDVIGAAGKELKDRLLALRKSGLKRLYVTGSACGPELVRACEDAGIELYNCCGPSEGPIGFTCCKVTRADIVDEKVSIGKPLLDSVKFHIMKKNSDGVLIPLEDGEAGELYIESPTLINGYLNNAAKTSDNFKDIIIDGVRRRVFKTGDKMLRGDNGSYFYIGPSDESPTFKQGGERVEYASIRSTILSHPAVSNVKLIQRKLRHVTTNKMQENYTPVAIVQLAPTAELTVTELRDWLLSRLTFVEFPANIVFVDALQTTENGKFDMVWGREKSKNYYRDGSNLLVACRTELESKLCEVWSKSLGISQNQISIDDHYIDLGGDSVGYVQLIHQVEQLLGIQIPITDLCDCPKTLTIRKLANYIYLHHGQISVKELASGDEESLFMIPPVTEDGSASYLTFAAELKTELNQKNMKPPIVTFDVTGKISPEAKALDYPNGISIKPPVAIGSADLDVIAQSYVHRIKQYQPRGPYRLYGWSSGGTLAWKITELLQAQGDNVEVLGLLDSTAPCVKRAMSASDFGDNVCRVVKVIAKEHGLSSRLNLPMSGQVGMAVTPDAESINAFFNRFSLEDKPDFNRALEAAKAFLIATVTGSLNKLKKSPNVHACYATKTSADKLIGLEDKLRFLSGNKSRGTLGFSHLAGNILFHEFDAEDADHFSIMSGAPLTRLVDSIVDDLIRMRRASPRTHEEKDTVDAITIKAMSKQMQAQSAQMQALAESHETLTGLVATLLNAFTAVAPTNSTVASVALDTMASAISSSRDIPPLGRDSRAPSRILNQGSSARNDAQSVFASNTATARRATSEPSVTIQRPR